MIPESHLVLVATAGLVGKVASDTCADEGQENDAEHHFRVTALRDTNRFHTHSEEQCEEVEAEADGKGHSQNEEGGDFWFSIPAMIVC